MVEVRVGEMSWAAMGSVLRSYMHRVMAVCIGAGFALGMLWLKLFRIDNLRMQALASLSTKRFQLPGGAVFVAAPGAHRGKVLRFHCCFADH